MIAPTNALLNQHLENLREVMVIDEGPESIVALNGSIDWKKRQRIWDTAKIIVATPQVIRNDVHRGSIGLDDVCLLVADEAHHAIGKDASAEVGELYRQQATNALVLGATASPASTSITRSRRPRTSRSSRSTATAASWALTSTSSCAPRRSTPSR